MRSVLIFSAVFLILAVHAASVPQAAWKAGSLSLPSTAIVSSVPDYTGNGFNLAGSSMLITNATSLGDRSFLRFDGAAQSMNAPVTNISGGTNWLIAVIRLVGGFTEDNQEHYISDGIKLTVRGNPGGQGVASNAWNASGISGSLPVREAWQVIALMRSPSAVKFWTNGVLCLLSGSGVSSAVNGIRFGGPNTVGTFATYAQYDMAESQYFTNDISSEMVGMVSNLMAYYSIITNNSVLSPRDIVPGGLMKVDVEDALLSACAGDTIRLPIGTSSWTNSVVSPSTKANITFAGAGTNLTIIVDNAPKVGDFRASLFQLNGSGSRLTQIQFAGGTNLDLPNVSSSQSLVIIRGIWSRLDHCLLNGCTKRGITVYAPRGLIDNNKFDMHAGAQGVMIWNGVGLFADDTWSTPVAYGSTNSFYIEHNYGTSPTNGNPFAFTDSYNGSTWVGRYNRLSHGIFAAHGTESSTRGRGTRAVELYGNIVDSPTGASEAMQTRSGTALVFSNFVNGCQALLTIYNYREEEAFPTWGGADGENGFDLNDTNGVFASGTHTGSNGATSLTDSTKSWTPDQWKGCVIRNDGNVGTNLWFSEITGNSSNTIFYMRNFAGSQRVLSWNNGNPYRILKVVVTIDQPGRGLCTNLWHNVFDISGMVAWPNQQVDADYIWGNTLGATALAPSPIQVGNRYSCVQLGREYFVGIPKPGYTPLADPHPLALAGPGDPPPPPGPSGGGTVIQATVRGVIAR